MINLVTIVLSVGNNLLFLGGKRSRRVSLFKGKKKEGGGFAQVDDEFEIARLEIFRVCLSDSFGKKKRERERRFTKGDFRSLGGNLVGDHRSNRDEKYKL